LVVGALEAEPETIMLLVVVVVVGGMRVISRQTSVA
jgi:hypothetical protein